MNPEIEEGPMQICRARSKRSGKQCNNYALKGRPVCRMHGARGGPKTIEGYLACKKAPLRHGMYSSEALKESHECRMLMKKNKNLMFVK